MTDDSKIKDYVEITRLPVLDDEHDELLDYLPVPELIKAAGEMLTWPTEPAARSGDEYVFGWIHHQWRTGAEEEAKGVPRQVFRTTVPGFGIRLTAHPVRHRKGHWQAPFCWFGLDHPAFLGPVTGETSNRAMSPDPEVEKARLRSVESDGELAEQRRREQPRATRPGRWERENARAA